MIGELNDVIVDEKITLQKFNGDSTDPKDEVERIHIHNGVITHVEEIENGVVVKTIEMAKEVA